MADDDAAERRRKAIERINRELIAQGKAIEAGWQAYRLIALRVDMPTSEQDQLKEAFFAGCQHVFGTFVHALSPDKTPLSDDNMRLIDNLFKELQSFSSDMQGKYGRWGTA